MVSCNSSQKLEKEAMEQMQLTMKELAKDPTSMVLSDIHNVYQFDSLCILHFNFKGKNGLGFETTELMEYLYYVENGLKYEACYEAEGDTVFVNESAYEKVKTMSMYEKLPYHDGIKFRAIQRLNSKGRMVNNPDAIVELGNPMGTGLWDYYVMKDSFGDYTNRKYIVLTGHGVFSNSATTNSKMSCFLYVEDNMDIYMRLVEYNSSVVKDSEYGGDFRIKDKNGEIHSFIASNSSSGYLYVLPSDKLLNIIEQEGEISCYLSMGKYSRSTYSWRFKLDGYHNAVAYIQ